MAGSREGARNRSRRCGDDCALRARKGFGKFWFAAPEPRALRCAPTGSALPGHSSHATPTIGSETWEPT
jgi:hypothetical protein